MEYANAGNAWPEGALGTIQEYREDLEARMGKKMAMRRTRCSCPCVPALPCPCRA